MSIILTLLILVPGAILLVLGLRFFLSKFGDSMDHLAAVQFPPDSVIRQEPEVSLHIEGSDSTQRGSLVLTDVALHFFPFGTQESVEIHLDTNLEFSLLDREGSSWLCISDEGENPNVQIGLADPTPWIDLLRHSQRREV